MILFRYAMLFLLIYAGVVGLYFLNTAFSNADKKKATECVQGFHESHTLDRDLRRFIESRSSAGTPKYSAAVENTIFGIMKVTAVITTPQGEKTYVWKVDIVRNIIKPDTAETEQLMKDYERWK